MIKRRFGAWITLAEAPGVVNEERREFEVELKWDEADPLAVEMITYEEGLEPNPWELARDLWYRAMVGRGLAVGKGDIQIRRELFKPNAVTLCLRVGAHHAHAELPADEVQAFLGETIDVCAVGDEDVTGQVDEAIKELLG